MKQYQQKYAPNLTRYALDTLNKTITTKGEAEDIAEIVRAAIRAGTFQNGKARRQAVAAAVDTAADIAAATGLTLAAVVKLFDEQWLTEHPTKAADGKDNDRHKLNVLCTTKLRGGPLGERLCESLTVTDLIAFRTALGKRAHSTWNKYRTLLGQLFRWATRAGCIPVDPITSAAPDLVKLLRRKKAHQRRRRIDDLEWANLCEAARELRAIDFGCNLPALLVALFETGCRIGELLALQWGHIQLDARHLSIAALEVGASKSGSGRPIDISQPLYDLLVALAKQRDPAGQPWTRTSYVFGDAYGNRLTSVKKAWLITVLRAHALTPGWTETGDFDAEARAALQRIDLHIHDIRHEAACRWYESNTFNLAEIQVRLGHTTLAQTATYVHAASGSTKRAQDRYDQQRAAQQKATGTTGKNTNKLHTNTQKGNRSARKLTLVRGSNSF